MASPDRPDARSDHFLVRGGRPLRGTVDVSGSKNSALPILAACLMAGGDAPETVLHGVPRLSDVDAMTRLLGELGCDVRRDEPTGSPTDGPLLNGPLHVAVRDESRCEARYEIVTAMRASICVLGPLLAKRGRATFSVPGGCAIGDRPIDLHLRGLSKLGAKFDDAGGGRIVATVPGGRLTGCKLYLGGANGPTVLGTINVMSAAALADGTTEVVGAACEPEVADCAALLNKMGARITGAGTPHVTVEGVERLGGVEHRVIPDRIEAGTFLIAAAITGGDLTLRNCRLDHLTAVLDRLDDAGVTVQDLGDGRARVDATADRPIGPTAVATQPYPGFPTDLQAQLMALLCLAPATNAAAGSSVTERIYESRFTHVGELNRLGAKIHKEGATAIVPGVGRLTAARVKCSDLRASAALVLAALAADGESRLDDVHHIDRGYEKIERKLAAVGADIRRVSE